jgi:hypothetical protein
MGWPAVAPVILVHVLGPRSGYRTRKRRGKEVRIYTRREPFFQIADRRFIKDIGLVLIFVHMLPTGGIGIN